MSRKINYRQYLHRRGYSITGGSQFMRRLFIESLQQKGFHRLWRVWNPALGFVLFRLYAKLGGRKRHAVASCITFLFSGFFFHDLPLMLLLGFNGLFVTTTFFIWWALAELSRKGLLSIGSSNRESVFLNSFYLLFGIAGSVFIHIAVL